MPDIDINELLQMLQQQESVGADQNLEEIILNMLLNPNEASIKRIRLAYDPENNLMSEIREGVIINQQGIPMRLEEEVINIHTLDDGTPMNRHGICCCPSCGARVMQENLSMCACRKLICIKCATYSKQGKWFCSWWHRFLSWLGLL